jgi:hypothetical protein
MSFSKRAFIGVAAVSLGLALGSCSSTVPTPNKKIYDFPGDGQAFINAPKRPYKVLGEVKTKATYSTLDFEHGDDQLCRNYYNKAVKDLVDRAKNVGADAIVNIRSIVFYEDGTHQIFKTPECADDGEEGEILVAATAIKWFPPPAQR